jgi:hypothetical protein
LDWALLIATCHEVPLADHQSAPACCIRPVIQPGSAASKLVIATCGALACRSAAVCLNSSQVVGAFRPYWVKMSVR